MKKSFLLTLAIFCMGQFAWAQSSPGSLTLDSLFHETNPTVLQARLSSLRNSNNDNDFNLLMTYQDAKKNPELFSLLSEKNTTVLNSRLSSLRKSDKEDQLLLLASYYNTRQDAGKADSLNKYMLKKYPTGMVAFTEGMYSIFNETDGPKNEQRYASYVKRFSVNPKLKGHPFFDYVNYYVALSYINSNPAKMAPWIAKIKDSLYRAKAYSYGAAELMARNNNSKDAEVLIRTGIAELKKQKRTNSRDYKAFAAIASEILLANKKYAEGYEYSKQVDERELKNNENLKTVYMDLLAGTERYTEAYPMMEEAIKKGDASALIKERFPPAYKAVKGDTIGLAQHYSDLMKVFATEVKEKVAGEMVNVPAYNFSLKTPEGKTVTLESLRGKVVILDFWATWCGPCKASFPKMQMAVNTYKNDPEVTFLFVHTLEKTDNPTTDADNYLKANHYNFSLVMDLKDVMTKKNPAAEGFGLTGIPTKVIIDKNGNIRFRKMGNRGGEDLFMNEIKAMIELAKAG